MDQHRDGEKMRILQPTTPPARLLTSAISMEPLPIAVTAQAPEKSGHGWRFFFYFMAVLTAAALTAAGFKHHLHDEIAAPAFERPIAVIKSIRQNLPMPPATPMPVPHEALKVTSTSLGVVPIAIVNGKRLEEGDWLEVRLPSGVAALRVLKIEDNLVHFGYAGETIRAKFNSPPPLKKL